MKPTLLGYVGYKEKEGRNTESNFGAHLASLKDDESGRASRLALTFAVCLRRCVQVPVHCSRKKITIPQSRDRHASAVFDLR